MTILPPTTTSVGLPWNSAPIKGEFLLFDSISSVSNVQFTAGSTIVTSASDPSENEPLFNPRIIHIDYFGLDEAIVKVIKSWDRENWEELLPNIILAGGGSLIPGLKDRLKLELTKYFSEKIRDKINVFAVSGRENMSWIGASILCSKNQLQDGWKPNPEYKG